MRIPTRAPRLRPALLLALGGLFGRASAAEIGALGRILPESGIVTLAGPAGTIIEKILVRPDQVVAAGDPLVVFAGKGTLELELSLAKTQRTEAESSGAKAIEIQQATLSLLEASSARAIEARKLKESGAKEAADHAAQALARLLQSGAGTYSGNLRAEQEHLAETARIGLLVAQAETQQVKAGFQNDMKLAKLELDRLKLKQAAAIQQADLKIALAEAQLARATLRAPSAGTVLDILQLEGEASRGPLISMADLGHMSVRTYVFQADLLKLKPGMRATITSKSLPKKLLGTLASTGRVISEEGRVAPAVIRLDEPETASRLLNLEVEVRLTDAK